MTFHPLPPAIPVTLGPAPALGASAWLVAWQDSQTGLFIDAGIYSEATPTCVGPVNGRHARPVVLLKMQSRLPAGAGGYERASRALEDVVARRRDLAWATQTRTYSKMTADRRRRDADRAAGVVRVIRAPHVVR
jgi:hypothetical protein